MDTMMNTERLDNWVIDSGATVHICKNKEKFSNLNELSEKLVRVANGKRIQASGQGEIVMNIRMKNGKTARITLTKVLYVPEFERNLISIKRITQVGHQTILDNNGEIWLNGNKEKVIPIFGKNKLYTLDEIRNNVVKTENREPNEEHSENYRVMSPTPSVDAEISPKERVNNKSVNQQTLDIWHARLAHIEKGTVLKLVDNVKGMKIIDNKASHTDDNCRVCTLTKMTRRPFYRNNSRASKPFELVYSDIQGPMRTKAIGGNETYSILFVDNYSRYTAVY